MTMLMKIMCKIKIIIIIKTLLKKNKKQTNKQIQLQLIKHLYITEKTLTGEEREKKNYYIQTIKRLPCLKCSVNITFIKTKRTKT